MVSAENDRTSTPSGIRDANAAVNHDASMSSIAIGIDSERSKCGEPSVSRIDPSRSTARLAEQPSHGFATPARTYALRVCGELPTGSGNPRHAEPVGGTDGPVELVSRAFAIAAPVALPQRAGQPVPSSDGQGRRLDGFLQGKACGEGGDGFVVAAEEAEHHAPVAIEGSQTEDADSRDDELARVEPELVGDPLGVLGSPQSGGDLGGFGERERPVQVARPTGPAADEMIEDLGGAPAISGLEQEASGQGAGRVMVRRSGQRGLRHRQLFGGPTLLECNGPQ